MKLLAFHLVFVLCPFLGWSQTTVTNGITISFTHGAWGQPKQVWAGLTTGGFGEPDNVGSIVVTAEDGTKGAWDIQAMEFIGAGIQTWLNVAIVDGANNVLSFYDPGATVSGTGRKGKFTSIHGTGAFHTGTANMTYSFDCIDPSPGQCYQGQQNPVTTNFLSHFSASGSITVTISVQKPPPTKPIPPKQTSPGSGRYVVNETPGGGTTITEVPASTFNPTPTPQVKAAHAEPDASATNAAADGTLAITVPSQQAPVTYTATAACANLPAACWLTVPSPTGTLPVFTAGSVVAGMNFDSLSPGVYPVTLSVGITPTDGSIPPSTQSQTTTLIVNPLPSLQLSENAIAFQSAAGTQSQLLHSISLSSSALLNYTATPSTLTGGNWLSVAPASGSVSATQTGSLGILVNTAGLSAGSYFGRIDVNSSGASTAWQPIEVELSVLGPGTYNPNFSTSGLVFIAPQGSFPPAQDVMVSTFSNQPITITPAVDDNELAWGKVEAASTTLQAGTPLKQSVLVGNATLAPGAYPGSMLEAVGSMENPLALLYVVTPRSGTCTPTQLVPVFTTLYSGFEYPAGLPISVQAQIVDDCGNPLNSGSVYASFGSDDPNVYMSAIGTGMWAGSWLSHGSLPGPAAVGITAQSAAGLQGSTQLTGTIDAIATLPVATPGGIVSAANPLSTAPLAPGQFISIYGTNLAATPASSAPPYPATLGGVQVLLGGVPLPLQVVSSGLINAVVPFDTPVNANQQLLISSNGVYSLPETVVVATASPAIFTQNESGSGAGVIVVYHSGGSVYETSPTQPASAGDLLLIYCDGLGPVNPAVADGATAPTAPPFAATVNPVTATIGGVPATVSFAGLAPGYTGVYQVNVTVPQGVAPGPNVPIVLTVTGFPSAPATVTIQ